MMKARDVQFRLLQVVLNHVADERVTVGLLHWDGTELRVALNPSRVPSTLPSKADLRTTLRALEQTLRTRADGRLLNLSLDDVSPVRLGETGLLSWGPLKAGQSRDSNAHFQHLVDSLHLQQKTERRASQWAPKFVAFAEELRKEVERPELIKINETVKGLSEHLSPLSWKNGSWRHTFPIALRPKDTHDLVQRIERQFGRIDASVPPDEIGVLVSLYEFDPALEASLAQIEGHIQQRLHGRIEALRAPLHHGEPNFSDVKDRVLKDLASASVSTL